MNEIEALRIVQDEAFGVWRELSKIHADEEQEMAKRLGRAIDVVDVLIDDLKYGGEDILPEMAPYCKRHGCLLHREEE